MSVRAAVVRLVVRVLFVLVLTAAASFVAWVMPSGVALFAVLAGVSLYVLMRLAVVGVQPTARRARWGGGS